MSPFKSFLAALSVAALCAPAFAATAPDVAGPQAWHKPTTEQMAAWHAQMCKDRYARRAGRMAYLEAALSITDAQRGAFDQWRNLELSAAKAHSDACLAHKAPMMDGHQPSIVERQAMMEKRLQDRLAGLQAERPALEALYASLTPEQKKLFDHMGGRFGHRHDGHFGDEFGGEHGRDGSGMRPESGSEQAPG